ESLLAYKAKPKLTYFRDDDEGGLALKTVAYNPSPLVRVLRKSTLMRYLFLNIGLKGVVTSSLKFLGGSERPVFIANTLAEPSPERVRFSKRAVDAFLARLPEAAGLTSEHIVFVVDGIRQQIYGDLSRETVEASFVHQIRSYFMANARALGYEVIDMHAVFGDYYRHNGKRFEFPKDNHWNSLGHGIAALAVRRSRVFSTFETGKE
ncbi:MAG: hypothetical protein O7G88_02760, partial [bacterium]|nr:hypothetical protein [bacterium]